MDLVLRDLTNGATHSKHHCTEREVVDGFGRSGSVCVWCHSDASLHLSACDNWSVVVDCGQSTRVQD